MTRTQAEVERLIAENVGLAYSESWRWGKDLDAEEREAAGFRGLGKAAMYWEPSRGTIANLASLLTRIECFHVERQIRRRRPERCSTDCRIPGKKGIAILGITANPPATCPLAAAIRGDVIAQAHWFLSFLPADAAHVVKMRYGIDCKPSTFEEIGASYGTSHTQAGNDYKLAMAHLRRVAAWTGAECAA